MESKKRQQTASDQPTTKPATKPATKSATKPTVKPETKSATACLMEQTLSLLLKCKESDQEFTADEATDTINTLIHHDNTHCSKCPRISVYLLVGAYYFELFKMQLSKFKSLVIEKEFSATNSQDKENKNLDDIKIQNCHTFSGLINVDSQKLLLLDNLISMIEVWQKLLGVKSLNPDLIGQLEVFEILRNSYFIFSFYGATKYSQLTGSIYLDLVLLHGQALKQHQLFANYCQIRLCLDCGLLEKARDYLKTSERLIKSAPENPANCLKRESYLIQIAECEWRLLSDENVEQAAADLNQLINEEYLRSNSTLSGYLRSLACFLLTKFSAKQFPSQNLVQCFHECHQFIRSVSCTWYPFLYELTPNDKRVNINSSLWLEFAVVKFTLEFSLTYNHYAANCWAGNSHFHFNILMIRLSRIYGSLLWLSRIILLSIYHEKPEVQKAKIEQVKKLFVRKKRNFNQIPSGNSVFRKTTPAQDRETVVMKDDCLDMPSDECANCQKTMPIYLLKKAMLKNPILSDEIEVTPNCDHERELKSLDGYLIPDLIVVRQELLLLLYLINESKSSFVRYFKQLDLDILNAVYFENLSDALNVHSDTLNRNHPNLITFQFNMRCLLVYLQNVELENSAAIDLAREVLKRAVHLGHSYEARCFIADLVLRYVESLLKEIPGGQSNIAEYDLFECEQQLAKRTLFKPSSPVRERYNLRSRVKPNAPKRTPQYKMDEAKECIQEMNDSQEVLPGKDSQLVSAKLNFTESDEEEREPEMDKKNLKAKIGKLKLKKKLFSRQEDAMTSDRRGAASDESQKIGRSQKAIGKSQQTSIVLKKNRIRLNSNSSDLNEPNNLTDRIGKLGFDETFEREVHEYLIDESSDNHYDEFKRLLYKVLGLFGSCPSIKHYNRINALLFRLSASKESTFGHEAPYYFSEICEANALRYKTVLHLHQKQVPIHYDSTVLEFSSSPVECKAELSRMIDVLPANWRVLQVRFLKTGGSQSDLYLARYQRNRSPILLKINVNSKKFCQNFAEEFNQIIQLSDESLKAKDPNNFWELRFALDERLKRLLTDVNSTWIGCFIGMFLGECLDENCQKLFREIERHLMSYAKKNYLVCAAPDLLWVVCESFYHLNEESFNHAMVSLFEPKAAFDGVYDKCLALVKKHFKLGTLEELKENITKSIRFGPLALITGPTLENFPFESLFSLRMLNQEVFRVPSVRFLNWMYLNLRRTNERVKQGVSDREVYYLVNPSKNLAFTEHYFRVRFEQLKNLVSCNWDGLIGQIPPEKELQRVLQNKDIYIYLGHGSGFHYLGILNESVVNCLSLVVGCSSAALSNVNQTVESFGSVYDFLMNGCPTYVGCLWNVTSSDVDRFTERLLKHTFEVYDAEENQLPKFASITKAVSLSRNVCKLKYLNGAAPVIWGLPISMRLEHCKS